MRAHVHVLSSERQGQRPVRAHVHELFSERQGQRPVRAHVHVLHACFCVAWKVNAVACVVEC